MDDKRSMDDKGIYYKDDKGTYYFRYKAFLRKRRRYQKYDKAIHAL